MKVFLLLFGVASFFLFAKPVLADSNVCNKTCQVNEECGKGYRCYVGICRATSCPSSPNCECIVATPTPQPKAVENLRVESTPQPKATPIASPSSEIKNSPKTGASVPSLLFTSATLAVCGLIMKGIAQS